MGRELIRGQRATGNCAADRAAGVADPPDQKSALRSDGRRFRRAHRGNASAHRPWRKVAGDRSEDTSADASNPVHHSGRKWRTRTPDTEGGRSDVAPGLSPTAETDARR